MIKIKLLIKKIIIIIILSAFPLGSLRCFIKTNFIIKIFYLKIMCAIINTFIKLYRQEIKKNLATTLIYNLSSIRVKLII